MHVLCFPLSCPHIFFFCKPLPSTFQFDLADGGEVSYLAKDLSISCDSQRYKQAYPFAVTMLFVYPIGIPLIYMVVLLHKRHTLTDKVAMKREALTDFPTTGHVLFLTEQYKPEFYYFGELLLLKTHHLWSLQAKSRN